jgi:hydrogenase maturation protein HypF
MTEVAMVHCRRVRLRIRGAVQGVGFRPYVYRIAEELGVTGWVANDAEGVVLEAEADSHVLDAFVQQLRTRLPAPADIAELHEEAIEPLGAGTFVICPSVSGGAPRALVMPDLATCDECKNEVQEPGNRREGYAFTNCTHCGPRFTIIQELPYDRPNTTMAAFTLCRACRAEYEDPRDRRFHAQPTACPSCGPSLSYLDGSGRPLLCRGDDAAAVHAAAAAIEAGRIVAVKGIGGYLLVCDAQNGATVAELRKRKHRPTKPFALMARDIESAGRIVDVDKVAEALLVGRAAPIVLLPRRPDAVLAEGVAPGHPYLGVMLPCAPLLHLLMAQVASTVVATSGNLGEEPISIDESEAVERLSGIADAFLTHDRPIRRHVDDSVAWIVDGAPRLLRRARGYSPLPVSLSEPVPPLLAVGAHMKNAVAVAAGRDVFVSQHIGDLETRESQRAFVEVIEDLLGFYAICPTAIAHDAHPDYVSTRWARQATARFGDGTRLVAVQHHHAHLAGCLAEHAVQGPALGVIWDGTGYGPDSTIWGGEFLLGDAAGYERVAHLRPFALPGGDAAVHEPDRLALALLQQLDETSDWQPPVINRMPVSRLRVLKHMMQAKLNTPQTTSAGRLFDAVAALLDLVYVTTYEGEAAVNLEFAAARAAGQAGSYTLPLQGHELDWRATLHELLADLHAGVHRDTIAARFHNALISGAVEVTERTGCDRVVLSGGCFQSRYLAERLAAALRARGFDVLQHRMVPPNDGGIALGQIAVAAARLRERKN